MATKEDCICERVGDPTPDDALRVRLVYNPRCKFHKGPDRGYGYDQWGQPNSKHSETLGAVIAGVFLGVVALAILFAIVTAFLKW